MRARLLASTVLVLAAATAAQAGTIDTGPQNVLLPVTNAVRYGQTFLADDGSLASFSFQVLSVLPGTRIIGEVYATAAGVPSGSALFTSASVLLPFGASQQTFSPGLALVPGSSYAIVIRTLPGSFALVGFTGNAYASGTGVISPNSGGIWLPQGIDLSTQIVTNPEPGTWALFGIGITGLGVVVRRRRRAASARP